MSTPDPSLTPDTAFARLAGLAARLVQAPSAAITLHDPDARAAGERAGNDVHEYLCERVQGTGAAVVVGDLAQDDALQALASTDPLAAGVRAWAGSPLVRSDGSVIGTLSVADAVVRTWSERDLDLLGTLADAAAAEVALIAALAEERAARDGTARALASERRARRRAEALIAAGVALSERNDAASVLRAVVSATVPSLGIWCAVHLRRRGTTPQLVAAGHRDPARAVEVWALEESGQTWLQTKIATPVLRDARAQSVPVGDDPRVAALGARHIVALPLRVRGHTIGALTVGVDPDDEPDAAATIAGVAGQAAVALDNAGLYDELAEVARTLQRALLPASLPDIPGVQTAVRFRPAAAAIQVGGDFYDVVAHPHRPEHAFVVGDVSGKGAGAATLTGVVRHTLRAAFFHGDSPEAGIALANEALFEVAEPEKFCTAIYGQLRVHDGHVDVRLVRAGHPAALVLRSTGQVDVLEPPGDVLGYRLDTTWEVATARLAPGDALLLYTDGAIEFPRRRQLDGDAALRTLAAELGRTGASATEIVEAVEHHTIVVSEGPLRDDLALLVLRCDPAPTSDAAPPGRHVTV
jgi:GAF domain-containing protein